MANESFYPLQAQIKHDALSVQDHFKDLNTWEESIKKKDKELKGTSISKINTPVRQMKVKSVKNDQKKIKSDGTAASHTYDRGYKKWENFNVEEALADVETKNLSKPPQDTLQPKSLKLNDEAEREAGNNHFRKGEFNEAVQCYTRCIAINPRSVPAYSNRAMSYIKLKEFSKAEEDCTLSLRIDNCHVKSWLRRGTARNALGKHRAALSDFEIVLRLEPSNRDAITESRKTRELIRIAAKRVPRTVVPIELLPRTNDVTTLDVSRKIMDSIPSGKHEKMQTNVDVPIEKYDSRVSIQEIEPGVSDKKPVSEYTKAFKAPKPENHRVEAIKNTPKLPLKPPKTSFEFERFWNSCKSRHGDPSTMNLLKSQYLEMIPHQSIGRIFQNSLSPDLLLDVIATLAHPNSTITIEKSMQIIKTLSTTTRFNMTTMLWTEQDKRDAIEFFDAIKRRSDPIMSEEIDSMTSVYNLHFQ